MISMYLLCIYVPININEKQIFLYINDKLITNFNLLIADGDMMFQNLQTEM